ncbi:hypothetical protein [Phaffia rhodozyma]|uniref:Uncharacterized protein n=1 Tax=Phaffia rhodozyma TaxID=264483 RepID=A0A0F7SGM4_PHARH|nr:hypothetical protein [Phaffia rhodozyma]
MTSCAPPESTSSQKTVRFTTALAPMLHPAPLQTDRQAIRKYPVSVPFHSHNRRQATLQLPVRVSHVPYASLPAMTSAGGAHADHQSEGEGEVEVEGAGVEVTRSKTSRRRRVSGGRRIGGPRANIKYSGTGTTEGSLGRRNALKLLLDARKENDGSKSSNKPLFTVDSLSPLQSLVASLSSYPSSYGLRCFSAFADSPLSSCTSSPLLSSGSVNILEANPWIRPLTSAILAQPVPIPLHGHQLSRSPLLDSTCTFSEFRFHSESPRLDTAEAGSGSSHLKRMDSHVFRALNAFDQTDASEPAGNVGLVSPWIDDQRGDTKGLLKKRSIWTRSLSENGSISESSVHTSDTSTTDSVTSDCDSASTAATSEAEFDPVGLGFYNAPNNFNSRPYAGLKPILLCRTSARLAPLPYPTQPLDGQNKVRKIHHPIPVRPFVPSDSPLILTDILDEMLSSWPTPEFSMTSAFSGPSEEGVQLD